MPHSRMVLPTTCHARQNEKSAKACIGGQCQACHGACIPWLACGRCSPFPQTWGTCPVLACRFSLSFSLRRFLVSFFPVNAPAARWSTGAVVVDQGLTNAIFNAQPGAGLALPNAVKAAWGLLSALCRFRSPRCRCMPTIPGFWEARLHTHNGGYAPPLAVGRVF